MTQLEALNQLLEKVGAGVASVSNPAARAFEPESGGGPCTFHQVSKAYNGSMDAALSLFDSVLSGWVISSIDWKWGDLVEANVWRVDGEGWHTDGLPKAVGASSSPACALLIAIIKAKIAELEA